MDKASGVGRIGDVVLLVRELAGKEDDWEDYNADDVDYGCGNLEDFQCFRRYA